LARKPENKGVELCERKKKFRRDISDNREGSSEREATKEEAERNFE
jgi:hypothetical protein